MKHLKSYENINKNKLNINDYVIMNSLTFDNIIVNFVSTHVGQIKYLSSNKFGLKVEYNYPNCPFDNPREFSADQIVYTSKNINDCQLFLQQQKYNL